MDGLVAQPRRDLRFREPVEGTLAEITAIRGIDL
jgi:hypothetical protein